MGNEIKKRLSPTALGALILCGKIALTILIVAILGFIIYKIVKYVKKDEYEDDKTNYEEDIQCLNQDRGKSKNNY